MSTTTLEELVALNRDHDCPDPNCVALSGAADLPTRFGHFRVVAFGQPGGAEHAALIRGEPWGREDVPVRLHSECLTGDAIGSLRCDCRDQLEASLRFLGEQEAGIVLYLRQEGRGIGLVNKIRAYELQDVGLDTVEANRALGFRDDERDYGVAAHMLGLLRVQSIRIITNNPRKVAGTGVTVNLVLVRTIDVEHKRDAEPSAKTASWTTPEEISAVIGDLLGEAARSVNGAKIPLYGNG